MAMVMDVEDNWTGFTRVTELSLKKLVIPIAN
jgi:hypothetical protein